jgi:hypothetical protein
MELPLHSLCHLHLYHAYKIIILPVAFYWYENWSYAVWKKHTHNECVSTQGKQKIKWIRNTGAIRNACRAKLPVQYSFDLYCSLTWKQFCTSRPVIWQRGAFHQSSYTHSPPPFPATISNSNHKANGRNKLPVAQQRRWRRRQQQQQWLCLWIINVVSFRTDFRHKLISLADEFGVKARYTQWNDPPLKKVLMPF